ncbi:MAG: M36 family metallopeptidase, partial [Chloroflexota bacterium]
MVKRPIRAFLSFSIGLLVLSLITLTFSVSASPPPLAPEANLEQAEMSREKEALARAHLSANREAYNLSVEEIKQLEVTDLYTSQHSGVTHVYFRQTFNGLPILNGLLNVNLQPNGQALIIFERTAGNQAQWERRSSLRSLQLNGLIEADQAVASAIEALEIPRSGIPTTIRSNNDLRSRSLVFADGSSPEPIPAERAYFAKDGALRPIWEITIDEVVRPHKWVALVDAESGDLLDSYDLVLADQWGVLPEESGRGEPFSTSFDNFPAVRGENQLIEEINQQNSSFQTDGATYRVLPLPLISPLDGPFSVVTEPSDPQASPFGWHDTNGSPGAEYTDTRGNNVYVQEDADNNNTGGERVSGGNGLTFDYRFDPSLEPDAGSNAEVAGTNLFYINNKMHDIFYRYGFDEAAGNFQQNNYGKGGVEGDPLLADFHDGRTTNNAYFTTGVDGQSPRMEMFIWEFATPFRDSALDNSVIIHEYAHGVTTRLTGGPSSIQCLFNNEQMGEGWSDFFGLVLTMQAGDERQDPRGYATYLVDQVESNRGIRLAPYSTDFTINDYTYADMQAFSSGSGQPHQVGFLYATMLWELTWDLIDEHGFNPDVNQSWITGGNNLALQLVIDSLKIQPCQPGFVDSRDAILAADQSLTGGENKCTIWEAFARRGLGYSASQGDPNSTNDGSEAFDIPQACQQFLKIDKQAPSDLIGVNRVLSYTLVITNDTTGRLTNLVVTDPIPENVTYVDGSASDGGRFTNGVVTFPPFDLAVGETTKRSLSVQVDQWEENHALAFVDNFEQGLMAWEATSLWHAENQLDRCGQLAAPFPSQDGAAYFGNDSC